MAEPREIKVKLTADVGGYVAAIGRATAATKGLAESLDGGDVQRIRTGATHRFPRAVATARENETKFIVDPMPEVDHASRALRKAQAEYALKWNLSPEEMADMIWTLRKTD